MLRRANDVFVRARERIRIAAEHDPHAWPERDDDRAILVHDDDPEPAADGIHEERAADTAVDRPPLGSPEPGAPDLDGVGPGGVSGPPEGGRPPSGGPLTPPGPTPSRSGAPGSGLPSGGRSTAVSAARSSWMPSAAGSGSSSWTRIARSSSR